MKHQIGVEYTRAQVVAMYGEEFFFVPPRPVKPRITVFAEFDAIHQQTYLSLAEFLRKYTGHPVQCWAFGSRIAGRWMLPEEDPTGRGSDWDICTTATHVPTKNEFDAAGFSGIRIDCRGGGKPPRDAVAIPPPDRPA